MGWGWEEGFSGAGRGWSCRGGGRSSRRGLDVGIGEAGMGCKWDLCWGKWTGT